MRLEHVLCNVDRAHIGLIDRLSLDRNEHTRHGLHLNLSGKEKLMQLIVNKIRCNQDTGKIPVITDVRSRFF
jgi:hypothetical protein